MGKVTRWSTKEAMFLKRVEIEEKYYEGIEFEGPRL